MKDVIINEKDAVMYEKFLKIKQEEFYDKRLNDKCGKLAAGFCIISGIVSILILNCLIPDFFSSSILVNAIVTSTVVTADVGLCYYGVFAIEKIFLNKEIKNFKKEYTNFDMNTSVEEANKELENYYKTKNLEDVRDQYITALSHNIEDMTAEEKLEFLNREKEFWQQEKIKETLEKLDEYEVGFQKRK